MKMLLLGIVIGAFLQATIGTLVSMNVDNYLKYRQAKEVNPSLTIDEFDKQLREGQ